MEKPDQNQPVPSAKCRHFGTCGGCSLQHLSAADYQTHKHGILLKTMSWLNLPESLIEPLIQVAPRTRRRVDAKIRTAKDGTITIGFNEARSHQIIQLEECPVAEPRIEAALLALRVHLAEWKKPKLLVSVEITAIENRLDVLLHANGVLNPNDLTLIAAFAEQQGWLRLSLQKGENIKQLYRQSEVLVSLGGVEVELPAGAFLQATKTSEDAMIAAISEMLTPCQHVVDLYSGCGTYCLPLAKSGKRVSAYEGSEPQIMALHNAARRAGLDASVNATVRDLFKHPLSAAELNQYDGAVLNPPRNGALPQAKALAASDLRHVVMVSCNPSTFERDAKALMAGGFKLIRAIPIDQFLWSEHLEVIGAFER